MKTQILLVSVLSLAILSVFALSASAQDAHKVNSDSIERLVGDWSGESICMNKDKFPACHDEVVVYHIKKVADKPNTINLSADKIVNGKPENMGDFDFVYDAKKQTLFSEFKNDRVHHTIEFDIKGDVLEGGMYSYPDRMEARRMKVTKNK